MRIIIDTGVWISFAGGFREEKPIREKTAVALFDFFNTNKAEYKLFYSQRTYFEIKSFLEQRKSANELNQILQAAKMLKGYWLNETWEKITELTWENIASKFGDNEELKIGQEIESNLPDKLKKENKIDRGILGDAIFNKCELLIHENPKDFNKVEKYAIKHNVQILNLLDQTPDSICKAIVQINKK